MGKVGHSEVTGLRVAELPSLGLTVLNDHTPVTLEPLRDAAII